MQRKSIIISILSVVFFVFFWSSVYYVVRFFPNSEAKLKRPGFESSVTVKYDEHRVPILECDDKNTLIRAQGLVTARDRFFQMELIRRKMAGKLSELFGEKALSTDLWHRQMGFSEVAKAAKKKMKKETLLVWDAYAQGVNDYLNHETLPWEIKILGYQPELWTVEDGFLVVMSMFEALNEPDNTEELAYNELYRQFSQPVVNFITWDFGLFDAPLKTPREFPFRVRIPKANELNFRSQAFNHSIPKPEEAEVYGSNAWVVSGIKTLSGKPLLAGDPHLNLTVPNLWYRTEMKSKDLSVRGAAIPGIPGVVIGRNEKIAWSFTNSRADVHDFVDLGPGFRPEQGLVYQGNSIPLTSREESIPVKGKTKTTAQFWDSPFGPLISETNEEAPRTTRILQWTALDPAQLADLNPLELNSAKSLEELWDAMSRWGGPVQNMLIATQDNHIAWGMVGKIPAGRKDGGRKTVSLKDGFWKGYVPWQSMPKVVNPPQGFIASGNQNLWVEDYGKETWGHDWPSPARGFQIKNRLSEGNQITAEFMESVQNDIYSPVHVWYRDRLIETVQKSELKGSYSQDPFLDAIIKIVQNWDGKVVADSAAYPLLKEFRLQVQRNCIAPFVNHVARYRQKEVEKLIAKDPLVKNLLDHRPQHLLNPKFDSWEELILSSAIEAGKELAIKPEELSKIQWGQQNRLQAQHPFSNQLPKFFSRWLNLPEKSLPGDGMVIRVGKPKNGASMRVVIDLAEFKNSRFSQPGGQSGYFLSPYYQDLFEPWYLGKGVPFEAESTELKQVIVH